VLFLSSFLPCLISMLETKYYARCKDCDKVPHSSTKRSDVAQCLSQHTRSSEHCRPKSSSTLVGCWTLHDWRAAKQHAVRNQLHVSLRKAC
jgi:hypothetical protein